VIFIAGLSGQSAVPRFHVRAEVHARGVPPGEEGFPGFVLALNELFRGRQCLLVHRFHPLLRQRTGVLYRLTTLAVSLRPDGAAWAELLKKRGRHA